jgi:hypothetical protein
MKWVVKILMFSLISFFLVAGSAMAVPFGDGGTALQAVLDDITVNPSGNSSVDVTTDEVPDAEDSIWTPLGQGTFVANMIIELTDLAESNTFGIFDAANPNKKVQLYAGSAATGTLITVSILADGSVFVNGIDTGIDFAGNAFGFYLDSSSDPDGGIWFSDTNLNSDRLDHMAAYQGEGDTIQILPFASGIWPATEFILAFEDREADSADKDYDDMVVIVEAIAPSPPVEVLGCRLTGGGVTEDDTYTYADGSPVMVWDGTHADADMLTENGTNRYHIGGQVGAETVLPPQPSGEWEHTQQSGPAGRFSFHAGTHSAPAGTEIVAVRCSDPGGCKPSGNPPSPNKQIDFECIGTFQNIGQGKNAPMWMILNPTVTAEGRGNQAFDGTFHWCEVNVDDLGEGPDPDEGDPVACPPEGFGEKGAAALANCDCPDFYRITIYDGVNAAEVTFLPDGNIDPNSLNRTDVIYEVEGYLGLGGNGLQLHEPTGHDR